MSIGGVWKSRQDLFNFFLVSEGEKKICLVDDQHLEMSVEQRTDGGVPMRLQKREISLRACGGADQNGGGKKRQRRRRKNGCVIEGNRLRKKLHKRLTDGVNLRNKKRRKARNQETEKKKSAAALAWKEEEGVETEAGVQREKERSKKTARTRRLTVRVEIERKSKVYVHHGGGM